MTSVIIGAKKAEQLADNIAATEVALGADELKRLDEVSALPAEYPGWMFTRQGEVRRRQMADAARTAGLSGETPRRAAAAGPNNGPIRRPR